MPTPTAEEFLSDYSPEVRDISLRLREIVLDAIPNACEKVQPGWKAIWYGTGEKMNEQLCALSPLGNSVNLGFSKGAELPDPKGLLHGTGKSIRHVKVKRLEEIDAPALRALLEASLARK